MAWRIGVSLLLMMTAACGSSTAPAPVAAKSAPDGADGADGAPATAAELDRIDVFGSKRLSRDEILARWGQPLVELMRAVQRQQDPTELMKRIDREITAAGKLAYASAGVATYEDGSYVTVDLVDERDRAARMSFTPAPTATLADPDGLIALWNQYEEKMRELQRRNEIDYESSACPFWHCLVPFDHPELQPYREIFARRVPPVEQALAQVLHGDQRLEHRAAAAYLLAHLASGPRVIEHLLPSIRDSHVLVRNNAMRVIGMSAQAHPELVIPLEPFLDALHFPLALDRNKAAFVLHGLLQRADATPAMRELVRRRVGLLLVDMLAMRQPNNHDFAYLILKLLASRDFGEHGEHALTAWRSWACEHGACEEQR